MNKKFGIFRIIMLIGLFFSPRIQLHGVSSLQNLKVTIKNETPEEFIVKLINLESTQESPQILAPYTKGRDTIQIAIPPGQYVIDMFHTSNNKKVSPALFSENLRRRRSPGSFCITATLKPRLHSSDPMIEIFAPPLCV